MSKTSSSRPRRRLSSVEHLNIRRKYKQLAENVTLLAENGLGPGQVGESINTMKEHLLQTREYVEIANEYQTIDLLEIDADFMVKASTLSHDITKRVEVNSCKFYPLDFASKLVSYIKTNADRNATLGHSNRVSENDETMTNGVTLEELASFGKETGSLIQSVPVFSFICGTFDEEIDFACGTKTRKPRKKAEQDGESKQPTNIDATNAQNDDKTTKAVEKLKRNLKKSYIHNEREPVKYFGLVMDTESFSNTVENIFHSSFLIKESHAEVSNIVTDANRSVPLIKPHNSSRPENKENCVEDESEENVSNSQCVLTFDMKSWEKWIAECNRT